MTRRNRLRLWIYGGLLAAVVGGASYLTWMPGPSTPPPEVRAAAPVVDLAGLAAALRRDVAALGGERNVETPDAYRAAAAAIETRLKDAGYAPTRQTKTVDGVECANIECALSGGQEIVVVGAHYDSVSGSPGANDNGSGTAAALALARHFAGRAPRRTLRFVFFANEEPPYFQREDMGSVWYARRCKAREEKVAAMISLETIGYFSNEPGSQSYPHGSLELLYPEEGNFIAFVGNPPSAGLVRRCIDAFRKHATVPSEGLAMFDALPGVGWSDHWSFWQEGYPGVMVTDTAPFRYPYYHTSNDTPDRLDYDTMAAVVAGLVHVVEDLAFSDGP